ncbi:YbaB/EbfC family nucleoid-associated protein [Microbacterium sp. SL62]|uniref:YbaB/EbfC family nucleoid-associated protein n=1 Tax=Microbacterium sp. SL62 TaxID=2995139 RepID=UPI002276E13B|nr:YbaB/EbfC family nucleoid-associated protein [Microbacterium sp. SL62]MCY1715525.1 YbaB/EbfC family nucleoid-associated protein [Microbacterium sp. SL62]
MADLFSSREAEAAIARIEQQVAEAQVRAAQAQQVQTDIDAVRASATSPRRDVTVTVDAAGRLAGIRLADAAYDLRTDALEQLIVETAGRAQRLAGEQALEISRAAFGADSPIVERLAGEIDREPPSAAPAGFRV